MKTFLITIGIVFIGLGVVAQTDVVEVTVPVFRGALPPVAALQGSTTAASSVGDSSSMALLNVSSVSLAKTISATGINGTTNVSTCALVTTDVVSKAAVVTQATFSAQTPATVHSLIGTGGVLKTAAATQIVSSTQTLHNINSPFSGNATKVSNVITPTQVEGTSSGFIK